MGKARLYIFICEVNNSKLKRKIINSIYVFALFKNELGITPLIHLNMLQSPDHICDMHHIYTERDRQTQTDRQTDRHRHTDTQTHTQIQTDADSHRHRHTDTEY